MPDANSFRLWQLSGISAPGVVVVRVVMVVDVLPAQIRSMAVAYSTCAQQRHTREPRRHFKLLPQLCNVKRRTAAAEWRAVACRGTGASLTWAAWRSIASACSMNSDAIAIFAHWLSHPDVQRMKKLESTSALPA